MMEARATTRSRRQTSYGIYDKLFTLTMWAGVAFWASNFATSLLPVAAEYRAALSISYLPMVLLESLVGGLVIGCCVSYFLLRFFDQVPTKSPILKAGILSFVALLLAVIMAGVSATRLEARDALRYFLIGAMLNVPRFLTLGIVVGSLYKRLYGSASPKARADQTVTQRPQRTEQRKRLGLTDRFGRGHEVSATQRRAIRYGAAVVSGAIAAIYLLIGLGVLTVIGPTADDLSMAVFGFSAGGAFLLGALLLVAFDRRVLWVLGAVLQVLVVWGYFAVAPDRTPAFEVWGITLRFIQLPLFAALVYLSLRPPQPHDAHMKIRVERSRPT